MEKPNYQKIYQDIVHRNFPDKFDQTKKFFQKKMDVMDVIKISEILNANNTSENQKHKSYDVKFILNVLKIQKNNFLTNKEVAEKYKLSRNTVSKWKKIYG